MTKTERLNELFDRWIREFPEYKGKFIKDGIVDENEYNSQKIKLKLLFITKEPNDPHQSAWDFREWWAEEVKYSFSHRICEWAFGFLNGFPPIVKIPYDNKERIKVMKKIAFMNLKKSGGKANANYKEIEKVLVEEKHLLLEEIDIIEPDIIIGGLGKTDYWRDLFPTVKFKDSGFDIKVARVGKYKIIDFYHPSYRVPRSMTYTLLGAVSKSKVFTEL